MEKDWQVSLPAIACIFSVSPFYYTFQYNTKATWELFSTEAMLDHKTHRVGFPVLSSPF